MGRSRPVLIAGAGIAGLAAAIALAKAGFHVLVLERDRTPDTSGAGIQLSPNATRALEKLGVLSSLLSKTLEPDVVAIANAINGKRIVGLPLTAMRETFGFPYLVCLRTDLHQTLAEIAGKNPRIDLRYGTMLSDFRSDADGVCVDVARGDRAETIAGLALVGADGIRSHVRALLHPDTHPRHSGMSAWRATVPAASLPKMLQGPRVQVWLGPAAHLVHYPVGDGGRINLVAVTKDRDQTQSWGEAVSTPVVLDKFAHWNQAAKDIMACAPDYRRWSIYEAPKFSAWGKGATTLIGDAAHGMYPFIAQGAASALEDAVALAEALEQAEDVEQALRAFERARLPRTRKMQSTARKVGRIYHLRQPFALSRDLAMKRLGSAGLLRRNEWLYRG